MRRESETEGTKEKRKDEEKKGVERGKIRRKNAVNVTIRKGSKEGRRKGEKERMKGTKEREKAGGRDVAEMGVKRKRKLRNETVKETVIQDGWDEGV